MARAKRKEEQWQWDEDTEEGKDNTSWSEISLYSRIASRKRIALFLGLPAFSTRRRKTWEQWCTVYGTSLFEDVSDFSSSDQLHQLWRQRTAMNTTGLSPQTASSVCQRKLPTAVRKSRRESTQRAGSRSGCKKKSPSRPVTRTLTGRTGTTNHQLYYIKHFHKILC